MASKILFPCKFIGITSGYKTKERPTHSGIDLGWNRNYGGQNQPILAPFKGTVADIKTNVKDGTGTSYGNYILLQSDSDKSVSAMLGHLKYNSFKIKKGDKVEQGQAMAQMGNTGNSNGNHCHYEVRINGTKSNPLLHTYATNDMVIAQSTLSNYDILKLDESKYQDVAGVAKDENTDQLQVLVSGLRIRKTPTTAADNQVGWALNNNYYNILDTSNADGYTWYKVDTDKWLAYKDTWIKIYYKNMTADKDAQISQLQKEVTDLENQKAALANEVIDLKRENENLNIDLQTCAYTKFSYLVPADNYYKIKLYQGETLIIK